MKRITFILALFISSLTFGQNNIQIASIGAFRTKSGGIIKNCKIGYRTTGKLNNDKSNVILWIPWLTGKSNDLINIIPSLMDTTGLYILAVDPLSNGESSSPSNTPNFPSISIQDMVKAEHDFLINNLKINHIKAVIGFSMGGMETFEWMLSYPNFMDYVIPIGGTPKQSFYDILLCQTEANIILHAKKEKQDMRIAMQRVTDINILHDFTPQYLATTKSPDSVNVFLAKEYKKEYNADNYFSQLQAMISHDIYKNSGRVITDIIKFIKCKVFVIVTTQDLFVNPINAIEFAKENNYRLLELNGVFGHVSPFFKSAEIKQAIFEFLK